MKKPFFPPRLKPGRPKPPAKLEPPPPEESKDRILGRSALTKTPLQRDLYELGHQRALQTADTRVDPDQLASLEALAEAMAREQDACEHDPPNGLYDAEKERQYNDRREEVQALCKKSEATEADVRRCRVALAECPPPGDKPSFPIFTSLFATVTIAFSVWSTAQMVVTSVADDGRVAMLISSVASIGIAIFIGTAFFVGCGVFNPRRNS